MATPYLLELPKEILAYIISNEASECYPTLLCVSKTLSWLSTTSALKTVSSDWLFLRKELKPAAQSITRVYWCDDECLKSKGKDLLDKAFTNAEEGNWEKTFEIGEHIPEASALGMFSTDSEICPMESFLHVIARKGSPRDVLKKILLIVPQMTWYTDANGNTAYDVAKLNGHKDLLVLLKPRCYGDPKIGFADEAEMKALTDKLNEAMTEELPETLVLNIVLRPQLKCITCFGNPEVPMWCPVPGFYGGFNIRVKRINALIDDIDKCADIKHLLRNPQRRARLTLGKPSIGLRAESFNRACGSEKDYLITKSFCVKGIQCPDWYGYTPDQ